MNIEVKPPTHCDSSELSVFQNLIIEGGEVTSHGLSQRINCAEKLVFINEVKCVAIGAIKNPNEQYKSSIFAKAGVEEKSENYTYELGWLYVIPAARGQGLGRYLMEAITSALGGSTCYATTRENNHSMHHLFSQYKFERLGSPYKSKENYSLVLYTNRP